MPGRRNDKSADGGDDFEENTKSNASESTTTEIEPVEDVGRTIKRRKLEEVGDDDLPSANELTTNNPACAALATNSNLETELSESPVSPGALLSRQLQQAEALGYDVHNKDAQISTLSDLLFGKELIVGMKDIDLATKDSLLATRDEEIAAMEAKLSAKDAQLNAHIAQLMHRVERLQAAKANREYLVYLLSVDLHEFL